MFSYLYESLTYLCLKKMLKSALVKLIKKDFFFVIRAFNASKLYKVVFLTLIFFYFPFWVCLTSIPSALFNMTLMFIYNSNNFEIKLKLIYVFPLN
jgi:hypothetical protein